MATSAKWEHIKSQHRNELNKNVCCALFLLSIHSVCFVCMTLSVLYWIPVARNSCEWQIREMTTLKTTTKETRTHCIQLKWPCSDESNANNSSDQSNSLKCDGADFDLLSAPNSKFYLKMHLFLCYFFGKLLFLYFTAKMFHLYFIPEQRTDRRDRCPKPKPIETIVKCQFTLSATRFRLDTPNKSW